MTIIGIHSTKQNVPNTILLNDLLNLYNICAINKNIMIFIQN